MSVYVCVCVCVCVVLCVHMNNEWCVSKYDRSVHKKKRIILVLHTCENNTTALFVQKLNNVANWKLSSLILNA